MEQTIALLKPDAVSRGHIGAILGDIEHGPFYIRRLKMFNFSDASVTAFYIEHLGRPYWEALKAHMCSGPCVAMVLEAPAAIAAWRARMGPSDPSKRGPGQIRWRYVRTGAPQVENLVHGSDSQEAFDRERSILIQYGCL